MRERNSRAVGEEPDARGWPCLRFRTPVGEPASGGDVAMGEADLDGVDRWGSTMAGPPTSASLDGTSVAPSLSVNGKLWSIDIVDALALRQCRYYR